MTTIPPMISARVDGIPGLAANGHTGQQSKMGDQSRQLGQPSIDRSSSDLLRVLVNRPGEVVSKGEIMAKVLPDLMVEESNLRFHIAQLRRALSDGQGGERYVTNVSRRGYCFVAPVGCAASPYIQHLCGRGDLSC